jgi:hypothetical protein
MEGVAKTELVENSLDKGARKTVHAKGIQETLSRDP